MESLILIGMILGAGGGILATIFYFNYKNNQKINEQSVLLLEKIKQICKLISVEGEFSEIYTHRDEKKIIFNLFSYEKKALIIINAKVFVGFDLSKFHVKINKEKKQISISFLAEPEILSIETDLKFYDIQSGLMNKFSGVDLTTMNQKAKDYIREKSLQSELMPLAIHQYNETILIIQNLIESVGWELISEKELNSTKLLRNLKS